MRGVRFERNEEAACESVEDVQTSRLTEYKLMNSEYSLDTELSTKEQDVETLWRMDCLVISEILQTLFKSLYVESEIKPCVHKYSPLALKSV